MITLGARRRRGQEALVPDDGGQTALHRVNEGPAGSPEGVVTSPAKAAAYRDEIVVFGLRAHRAVSDVHEFGRINAEVEAALDFYGQSGLLDGSPTTRESDQPA